MKISSDAKFTICENKPQRYANSERLMNQKIGMNMKRTNIKCAKTREKHLLGKLHWKDRRKREEAPLSKPAYQRRQEINQFTDVREDEGGSTR